MGELYQSNFGGKPEFNRPFAASQSRGTKPPYWRAKVALGQDKQRNYHLKLCMLFCLSYPRATFALQYGGFLPHEWLGAKGLFQTHFRKM